MHTYMIGGSGLGDTSKPSDLPNPVDETIEAGWRGVRRIDGRYRVEEDRSKFCKQSLHVYIANIVRYSGLALLFSLYVESSFILSKCQHSHRL